MVQTAIEKAKVLVEALPYIEKFHNKTVVIKYGGNAMINDELKKAVLQDVILMRYVGMRPVLVHGGGPAISETLARLSIPSEFIDGMRVTNEATMEVVEMVLAGKVNKDLVTRINQLGGNAVGISGKDGGMIKCEKLFKTKLDEDGIAQVIDLGFVGSVTKVDTALIESLLDNGYIPVIAPIGVDENSKSYNINADLVAGDIAGALHADKFVLLTDIEGVCDGKGSEKGNVISTLSIQEIEHLIRENIIHGGMIPKVECCTNAIQKGVTRAHIIDGRLPHSILLEIFTDEGIGTMIEKGEA
ncbi:MAG: acetylglutamate kinase [Clostridia bacterium]